MSLQSMKWTPVSMHKVVLEWLRAERHTNIARLLGQFPTAVWSPGISNLLDRANLDDPDENRARLRLLYIIRNVFVLEIPPDTIWYEVENLTHANLDELYVVNYPDWSDPADKNELLKVAARKKLQLETPPSEWEQAILWGHERTGPFTIMEGNHRLAAYAASGRTDLNMSVLIGLSPLGCIWHVFDHVGFLIQDLIRK